MASNTHTGEPAGLSPEELEQQAATELPDREALTVIEPEPLFDITPVSQQPLHEVPPLTGGPVPPTVS